MKKILAILLSMFSCPGFGQQFDENLFRHLRIGTSWTYETVDASSFLGYDIDWVRFTITDTVTLDGKNVFRIENTNNQAINYLWLSGKQMHFWQQDENLFRLNYDFEPIDSYNVSWTGACGKDEGVALISIDSLHEILVAEDTIKKQYLSIENSGTLESAMLREAYYGIGQVSGGLTLALGQGLCDFHLAVTELRCFESDSISYSFVDYPCDSTWFDPVLADQVVEADAFIVVPNPSNGVLHILTTDKFDEDYIFKIYDQYASLLLEYNLVAGSNKIDLTSILKNYANTYLFYQVYSKHKLESVGKIIYVGD